MREGKIEKHSIKEVKEGRIGGERSSLYSITAHCRQKSDMIQTDHSIKVPF